MDIKCYLAMTAYEFSAAPELPQYIAYMGCHFSSSGEGLSNLPVSSQPGSTVMVDDLIPPQDHDPELIAKQLTQLATKLDISAFLLDFQRPNIPENQSIAAHLTQTLPYPVGVTPIYAEGLNCPVFLPPTAATCTLKKAYSALERAGNLAGDCHRYLPDHCHPGRQHIFRNS